MTKTFDSWTDYDEWLKENCEIVSVTNVEERDNKIFIEYGDRK